MSKSSGVVFNKDMKKKQSGSTQRLFAIQNLEDQFKWILQQLPLAVVVFDAKGNAIMVNKAYLKLYNLKTDRSIIGHYNIYTQPLVKKYDFMKYFKRAYKGEIVVTPEVRIHTKEDKDTLGITKKRDIVFKLTLIPFFGVDGKVSHLISFRNDITALRKAQETVQSSEKTFRSMINAITESALLSDTKGVIHAINTTGAKRFGEKVENLIGKNADDFLPPDFARLKKMKNREIIKTGKPMEFETILNRRILHISMYPVFEREGCVSRIAVFAKDITRQRQIEKELQASEERFRAMIETSSDIIQVVNGKGIMTYVSPSVKRILGYTPQELIGKPSVSVVHPDDLPEVARGFEFAFKNPGIPVKTTCRCRHKNGTWRVLEGTGVNHLNNPLIQGFIANTRDITEKLHAELSVRESEEKFRSIIEQSYDGIVLIDKNGSIIEFNSAQEKMSGMKRADVIGKPVWDVQYRLFPDELRTKDNYDRHRKRYLQFLKQGKALWLNRLFDVEMQRPDRSRVLVQTTVFTIRLSDGCVYASFNRDVTSLIKTEKTLQDKTRELEKQYALLQNKNIALREVMAQLNDEKERIGRQIQSNVDCLLLPICENIRRSSSDTRRTYVDLLEENLKEIVSPFGNTVSQKMFRLTQQEIKLCTMIKQGMTSKEIARVLNISPRTVETHRYRIRKKLDVAKSNINLSTFLRSA